MPPAPVPEPLPLRVAPYADCNDVFGTENINGFMHRLAARNHWDSPGSLFEGLLDDRLFAFPCSGLSEKAASRLAAVSGVDLDVLGLLNPGFARGWGRHLSVSAGRKAPLQTHYRYLGAEWETASLALSQRRICPTCLEEEAYDRGIWGLLYLDTCPSHGCLLLERCPRCRKRFRFEGARPTDCTCGFDLRRAPAERASDGHRACAASIAARLARRPEDLQRLAALEVGQACGLLFRVGSMQVRAAQDGVPGTVPLGERASTAAGRTALGYALMAEGDHVLLTRVAELGRSAVRNRYPTRMKVPVGELQPELPGIEDGPMEALIREAAAYVADLEAWRR